MQNKVVRCGIIAILRNVEESQIVETATALAEGGITCMEVTFDPRLPAHNSSALRCVKAIQTALPKVTLGMGTVIRMDMLEAAHAAGASFVVSPNTNPAIIQAASKWGMATLPGAYTPSEAVLAHESGAAAIKLFPASAMPPNYIKALCEPLPHLSFFVVGGITPENLPHYIAAGACGAGIGGNLVDKKMIASKNFEAIRQKAHQYRQVFDQAIK